MCGPVYVPLCAALCTYVPLCAALCTSFVATYRAQRQVETKLMEPVVITIQVSHYVLQKCILSTLFELVVMTLLREHVMSLITLEKS